MCFCLLDTDGCKSHLLEKKVDPLDVDHRKRMIDCTVITLRLFVPFIL